MFKEYRALRKPWMDPIEIEMIKNFLSPDKVMLEWGSGGSTLFFSKYVRDYYSIEHDLVWGRRVREALKLENLIRACLCKSPNVHHDIVEVQPGPPGQTLKGPAKYRKYKDYIDQVDRLGVKRFDAVLIDGRAREYCVEKVLKYVDRDSVVFIHDYFTPGRGHYRRALKWFKIVDQVKTTPQTLAVFRKKQSTALFKAP